MNHLFDDNMTLTARGERTVNNTNCQLFIHRFSNGKRNVLFDDESSIALKISGIFTWFKRIKHFVVEGKGVMELGSRRKNVLSLLC